MVDYKALKKEIDDLWTFWLTHHCDRCPDDPGDGETPARFPTKSWPQLWNLMKGTKTSKLFRFERFPLEYVQTFIRNCEGNKHIQQVAYSSYQEAFTQICFTCEKVRSNLQEKKGE
jgi:hypothetical protein